MTRIAWRMILLWHVDCSAALVSLRRRETRVKLWCPELGSSRGEQEAGVCVSQTCGVQ